MATPVFVSAAAAIRPQPPDTPTSRSKSHPRVALVRARISQFCASRVGEGISLALVIGFMVLVVIQLVVPEEALQHIDGDLHVADLVFMWWFLLEIIIKTFATSGVYLRSGWNVFDALVVVISLFFSLLDDDLSSIGLLRLVRLRAALRLLRCVMLINQFTRHVTRVQRWKGGKGIQLTSPLEQAIEILQNFGDTLSLDLGQRAELEFVIRTLQQGDFYHPLQEAGGSGHSEIDQQTAAWLQMQFPKDMANGQQTAQVVSDSDGADDRPDAWVMSTEVHGFDEEQLQSPGQQPPSSAAASPGTGVLADNTPTIPSFRIQRDISTTSRHMKPNAQQVQAARSMRFQQRLQNQNVHSQIRLLEAVSRSAIANIQSHLTRDHGGGSHGIGNRARSVSSPRSREVRLRKLWDLATRNLKLRRLLKQINSWVCNVFNANDITLGHPLYIIAYNLLHLHGVVATMRLDDTVLQKVLIRIEAGYLDNAYHNCLHAADVVQTSNFFMTQPFLLPFVHHVDILGTLLAAAVHDYAHPGVNNAFEVATRSARAMRYNDVAVLENMHVASFFEQIVVEEEYNILKGLSVEDYRRVRQLMVNLVLGTDMARHFDDFGKLKAKLLQTPTNATGDASKPGGVPAVISTIADATFFLQLAVHTADVSNPAKPLRWYKMWVQRVLTEFYDQGDQERAAGLPISPFFDRHAPNIPKLQLGFIDFIVAPLFNEWARIIDDVAKIVIPLLNTNRKYWDRELQFLSITSERRVSSATPAPTVVVTAPAPAAAASTALSEGPAAATGPPVSGVPLPGSVDSAHKLEFRTRMPGPRLLSVPVSAGGNSGRTHSISSASTRDQTPV